MEILQWLVGIIVGIVIVVVTIYYLLKDKKKGH